MARDLLPSMGALMAFESAARHLSFSRAAGELHLTQGAVSRQIRQLESNLGLDLFERVNQRVYLTDAGRAYLDDVRRLLGELSTATLEVMASAGRADVLDLAVLSTFAARWLVPRLPTFLADHAGATINLSVRNAPFSFTDDPLDAAIHFGEGTWPGAVCEFLCTEESFPVAAPALRDTLGLDRPTDLVRAPLLHQSTRPSAWADWFASLGIATEAAWRGPRFDQFAMVVGAAVVGLGAALVPRFLIEEELAGGRLVVLFPEPLHTRSAYYVVHPASRGRSALLRAFADWIIAEAKG